MTHRQRTRDTQGLRKRRTMGAQVTLGPLRSTVSQPRWEIAPCEASLVGATTALRGLQQSSHGGTMRERPGAEPELLREVAR